MMKIYVCGGAIRDELMGLKPNDIDYVVVGSTPAEMESLGFSQVGKDFPVFLHPETNEEYALARKERKTGLKHTDFETVFDPTVTIEEDLMRRDLTINAIAKPHNFEGELVDPFGGQADIRNKILRHVSPAFQEDPLRVIRLARFAARFEDFTIYQTTEDLCVRMVQEGALDHLSKERIFEEFHKALKKEGSWKFFTQLRTFGLEFCKPIRIGKHQIPRIDDIDWLTEEQKITLKFCTFFGGYEASEIKDKMKAICVPTDYIMATLDCKLLIELVRLIEDDKNWTPDVRKVHKLISSVNWASRKMKDSEYIEFMCRLFGTVAVKGCIRSYMNASTTVQQFITEYSDSEGEQPSGRLIAEHLKATQIVYIDKYLQDYRKAKEDFKKNFINGH